MTDDSSDEWKTPEGLVVAEPEGLVVCTRCDCNTKGPYGGDKGKGGKGKADVKGDCNTKGPYGGDKSMARGKGVGGDKNKGKADVNDVKGKGKGRSVFSIWPVGVISVFPSPDRDTGP